MEVTLRAETGRTRGSRASRRLRTLGKVPAVVYGRDMDPVAIAVDRGDLYGALHTEAGLNALIQLEIEDGEAPLTMAKVVDRHPVRGDIVHVDFVKISLTEKTRVEVSIDFQGEPVGVREGGILETISPTVAVEALPTEIPSSIPLDVSDLAIGDTLRVSDLPPIEGVDYVDDPEEPIVTVGLPAAEIEEEVEEELLEEGEEELEEGEEVAEAEEEADE